MKRPGVAFILSFLLPGAGLWYLRKWAWGFVNLGAVLAVGVPLALLLPEETLDKYVKYIAIGLAAGSAGLAQAVAQQMNKKEEENADTGGTD